MVRAAPLSGTRCWAPALIRSPGMGNTGESTSNSSHRAPRISDVQAAVKNQNRKERVPVDEYTIEHIMPQNEDLPAA